MGRTKVDALKDLGNKITGSTLATRANETVVGMIDKITSKYQVGEAIILNGNISWLTGREVRFTEEADIEKLNRYEQLAREGKLVRFGFTAENSGMQSTIAKFADDIVVASDGESSDFSASFTAFLGTYGFIGIWLNRSSANEWTMNTTQLTGQE